MIKEFREFIMKGNVLELAVAVIMATYFGAIIKSLVDDILMPIIGMMLGDKDFSTMHATIGDTPIFYGKFIQATVVFIIVAFAVFMIIKAYNRTQQPKEEPAPAGPSELDILKEIRDELKKG